jgi:hypothetical protein
MALIIKRGARKAIAADATLTHEIGIYPDGIGGIEGHAMCYSFTIGEFRCIMSKVEWQNITEALARLEAGM